MKVLVVDDEIFISRMIKITLEAKDYEVIVAKDGTEGLDKALKEKPDVILLDIMMPVYDGFYILGKLKEKDETMAIPVIMLTSMARPQDITRAMELGSAGYVMKPFEYEDLIASIENALKKKDK
ncbi:MAG: response regulator [Candidatus Eremiobacterota bacterium]